MAVMETQLQTKVIVLEDAMRDWRGPVQVHTLESAQWWNCGVGSCRICRLVELQVDALDDVKYLAHANEAAVAMAHADRGATLLRHIQLGELQEQHHSRTLNECQFAAWQN